MTSAVPAPARVAGRLSSLDGLTPLTDTTATSDPQAAYQRLRDQWGMLAPVELEPGVNAWLVLGYDEICQVVKHERVFSHDPHHWKDFAEGRVPADSRLGPMMFPREHAYFKDGDVHRRLRVPLDESVSTLPLRQVRRENKRLCADLIAAFAANGHADLVSDYAGLIPMLAIAKMAGLDVTLGRELLSCLHALFGSTEQAQAANQRYEEILTDLMRSRQAAPGNDLTSVFVSHKNLRDDVEILQTMVLMVAAGLESTMAWIAQTLRLMLTDPRFAGRIRGGRLGVDDALDEVLWRDPPQANLPARFALRDVELAGQPVAEGDALILGLAAANADPRVRSEDLRDEIGNRSHLSWSAGPHSCPAHAPARIIAKSAVETALHLLPDIRLAIPAEEISLIPSPWNRCPATLPVTFTPGTINPASILLSRLSNCSGVDKAGCRCDVEILDELRDDRGASKKMKIDLFNEIQDPRPQAEGHEHARFMQAIEQAELADRLGYGCWWQVEHHGGEEFSLSSAPEIVLAAISQRTRRIRLGHSAVLAPGAINHPVRVAERAATLDHLSGGRLEVGLTRSTAPEWRLFGVDPAEVAAQTQEAFELVPRLWTGSRITHDGRFYHLDDVPVLPKPYQQPHPPLWQAATSPSSFEDAGRRGVGVLGTTLWESLDHVKRMIGLYRDAATRCERPVGAYVNNQVAYFTFVHCADTDEEAMRDGAAAAAAWYTVTALTFFEAAAAFAERFAQEQKLMADPSGGGLTGQFLRAEAAAAAAPNDAQLAIAGILQGEAVPDDKLFDALYAQGSLIVGSPRTCREKITAYANLGIDRLMTFQQVAGLPHDSVMRSIQLVGELIPEFDAA